MKRGRRDSKTINQKVFLCCLLLTTVSIPGVALDRQPNANYRARRMALANRTSAPVVLFAPVEAPDEVYGFRQENNFYYLSGLTTPGAALLLSPARAADGSSPAVPYTEVLFLPARNLFQEKWTGPQLGPENPEASKLTGFDRVADIATLASAVEKLTAETARPLVYTEVSDREMGSESAPVEFLKRMNSALRFEDVKPMLASLRTIKDSGEVALIRKAVDASVAAHFAAFKAVKPEAKEYEIAALMEYEWDRRGCERAAYAPIVGSGYDSTVLHYSADTNTMKSGDVVVIDAAGEYSMYAADITRTLPVNGHFTARQREIYDIVLGAQEAAMEAFQSGKSVLAGDSETSLYKVARDYINSHGKDLHGQPLGKYFIHGLGHYIGLSVHDVGDYAVPLSPGMAFTIEPGIYIPEENLGVRIEDDFFVDASGRLVKLSAALPSKAEDVEKAMAEN